MWLSESGQTTTILAATSTARRSHVIGALRTARNTSDKQAAARTNGVTHHTSNGRKRRMIDVSVSTGSAIPSPSTAGCSSRVHTVVETANETLGGGQRV